jgi:hypothetical protein
MRKAFLFENLVDIKGWTDELQVEAELAFKGEHYQTGEKLAKNRIKV